MESRLEEQTLPAELWLNIFSWLPYSEMQTYVLVCHFWYTIIKDNIAQLKAHNYFRYFIYPLNNNFNIELENKKAYTPHELKFLNQRELLSTDDQHYQQSYYSYKNIGSHGDEYESEISCLYINNAYLFSGDAGCIVHWWSLDPTMVKKSLGWLNCYSKDFDPGVVIPSISSIAYSKEPHLFVIGTTLNDRVIWDFKNNKKYGPVKETTGIPNYAYFLDNALVCLNHKGISLYTWDDDAAENPTKWQYSVPLSQLLAPAHFVLDKQIVTSKIDDDRHHTICIFDKETKILTEIPLYTFKERPNLLTHNDFNHIFISNSSREVPQVTQKILSMDLQTGGVTDEITLPSGFDPHFLKSFANNLIFMGNEATIQVLDIRSNRICMSWIEDKVEASYMKCTRFFNDRFHMAATNADWRFYLSGPSASRIYDLRNKKCLFWNQNPIPKNVISNIKYRRQVCVIDEANKDIYVGSQDGNVSMLHL